MNTYASLSFPFSLAHTAPWFLCPALQPHWTAFQKIRKNPICYCRHLNTQAQPPQPTPKHRTCWDSLACIHKAITLLPLPPCRMLLSHTHHSHPTPPHHASARCNDSQCRCGGAPSQCTIRCNVHLPLWTALGTTHMPVANTDTQRNAGITIIGRTHKTSFRSPRVVLDPRMSCTRAHRAGHKGNTPNGCVAFDNVVANHLFVVTVAGVPIARNAVAPSPLPPQVNYKRYMRSPWPRLVYVHGVAKHA